MSANGSPLTQLAISSVSSNPWWTVRVRRAGLPLHTGIQAGHAEPPIVVLPIDLHLPHGLGRGCLCNLKNRRTAESRRALVKFHISVGQQPRAAAEGRENRR